MSYAPRWYQTEASQALYEAMLTEGCNPIAVLPTGSGKTFTLCEATNLILTHFPTSKILILSHVSEILDQNYESLSMFFEGIEIGLFSASLGSRTTAQITVAGIQSVYRKPERFSGGRVFILVDECHIVPEDEKSMYRSFFKGLDNCKNIGGLTATPFKTGSGYIYKGPNAIFNEVCYDLSSFENYNRLVDEGFLSPLVGKSTHVKLSAESEKIRTTAGDYNIKDLSTAFDRAAITDGAINEILHFGEKRNLWLIFAIDIEHAENIANNLRSKGIKTACVHSRMEESREVVIQDIKAGKYRAVVNVDVLTTGFDAPNVDLIALLRPTKSPGLHVQMLGRGARVVFAPGSDVSTVEGRLEGIQKGPKQNCMVLDFAGNIMKLGPINDPIVKDPTEKNNDGGGEPIMKECPECMGLNYGFAKHCFNCGTEFLFKEKIKAVASEVEAMRTSMKTWMDVKLVNYSIHQKKGSKSSLRVMYTVGLNSFSEWICYDHTGFAAHRARNWVKARWPKGKPLPQNLNELFANRRELKVPTRIFVDNSKKFPEIKMYRFD